ncbi:Crp/Fnr family transcriptional regulator [Amycolatopsis sp. 195334CR]|uniref:Crp/Fnr family transcriptional regulator n=1 Tax=Amycolatopsis sp. 195334CR TaxID=2814588 RepID=UPI001A90012C|nr:Crp/Fnr family transcriptional regulator [Amycolatopsis sp. 195334CR]MBN6042023.1 Crp/Fnr family transcriptional regulator [Amycolatopsis sp. 195334CR]
MRSLDEDRAPGGWCRRTPGQRENPLNQQEWPKDTLVARLSPRARRELLELGALSTFGARQTVLRQGASSHHVLVILAGHVKVRVDTEFGGPVLLALRGRGDLLGEMSVFESLPRSANVVTCSTVQARVIRDARFHEFLDRYPEAWAVVARGLSERLRWANRRRADFVACPAPVRVSRVLADIAQRYGERTDAGWDLDVSLTQLEIASLAGVALATLEKALQVMQGHGLVRRRYRRIVVEDLGGLCRFGELDRENPYQYGVGGPDVAQS